MIVAVEISDWNEPYDMNHVYLMSDDMREAYAYVRNRDLNLHEFIVPFKMNLKYRKFKVLEKIDG